ncbi:MAG: hypothetical protein OIN83_02725 [Candidatus Methanoperedens sp.]|nr:hypothetical protein [Candidatus Methanoperedens sp.]
MIAFIDSVVWIGAKLRKDQWHKQSAKIIKKFINEDIQTAYVTDYIVLESVNFILRKGGFDAALETLNIFENVQIYSFDKGFDMISWIERLE